jgi:hypothetical protein
MLGTRFRKKQDKWMSCGLPETLVVEELPCALESLLTTIGPGP